MEVARVVAYLGFKEDTTELVQYEKHVKAARTETKKPIEQPIGWDEKDAHVFSAYQKKLKETQATVARKERFRAKLGADFDARSFNAAERAMKRTTHVTEEQVKATGRLRTSFGTLWSHGAQGAAAIVGFYGLEKGVHSVVEAYGEHEVAQKKLNTQMKASGEANKKNADSVEEVIKKNAEISGIAVPKVTDAYTNLLRATNDVNKANSVLSVTTDIARAKHIDVEKAGLLVGKVMQGNTGILTRYGIILKPVTTATDKLRESSQKHTNALINQMATLKGPARREIELAIRRSKQQLTSELDVAKATDKQATAHQALAALQQRFSGQAESYGKTQQGAADRAKASWEEVRAAIGEKLAPVLKGALGLLTKFAQQLLDGKGVGGQFVKVITTIGSVLGELGKKVGQVVGWFKQNKTAVELLIGALKVGTAAWVAYRTAVLLAAAAQALFTGGGTIVAFVKLIGSIRSLKDAWILLDAAMDANLFGLIVAAVAALAAGLYILYTRSATARKIMDGTWKALRTAAETVFPVVKKLMEIGLIGPIGIVITNLHSLEKVVKSVFGSMKHVVSDFVDFWLGSVTSVLGGISSMLTAAGHLPGVGGKFKDAAKAIDKVRDSIDNMRGKLHDANKPINTVKGNIKSLGGVASDTAGAVINDLNAALGAMGAKKLSIHVGHSGAHGAATDLGAPDIGGFSTHAGGGIPHPGSGSRDDHILIDPRGRPVAAMSGTEGILNTPQMGVVDYALGGMAAMGLLPPGMGGLNQLWGSGMKHYAGGGAFPGVSGDTDFLPALGRALSSMARSIGQTIFVQSGRRTLGEQASLVASKGLYNAATNPHGAAAPSPNAPHVRGVAADITPGREVFGSAASRFGLGFTVPTEPWHIQLAGSGAGSGAAGVSISPPTVSGTSPIGVTMGRQAGKLLAKAANAYIGKHAPSFTGGETGVTGGGGGGNRALGHTMMRAFGFGENQWSSLNSLWTQESGWDAGARNSKSGAAGIVQDITGNMHGGARGQIAWGLNYIKGRYGTPAAAWAHEQAYNWYRGGGQLRRLAEGGHVYPYDVQQYHNFWRFGMSPGGDRALWHQPGKGLSPSKFNVRFGKMLSRWLGTKVETGFNSQFPVPKFAKPWERKWMREEQYAQGGLLPHFTSGGALHASQVASTRASAQHAAAVGQAKDPYHLGVLSHPVKTGVKEYDSLKASLADQQTHYGQVDRAYGQSDEVFINPDTGALDMGAIHHRVRELDKLLALRQRIVATIEHMRAVMSRIIASLHYAIARTQAALAAARKKDRPALKKQLAGFKAALPDHISELHQLGFDVIDARLDVGDIRKEKTGVLGTQPELKDTTSTDGSGGGSTDTSTGGGITADQQAQINQAAALKAIVERGTFLDTTSAGILGGTINPQAAGGVQWNNLNPGAIGQAVTPALAAKAAAMGVDLNAPVGGTAGGSAGGNVQVVFNTAFPPSPQQAEEAARGVVAGLSYQGSVNSPRTSLGV
jgi:hypothetical protein